MKFTLNGETIDYTGDENLSLLKFLREIKNNTSAKDGCSGEGVCGACSVEIDGRAMISCRTIMKRIEGKSIITPDGMEQKLQEAFAHAFTVKGGIQCGYCTPGIVISAKALLAKNPTPSRDEITKAINRNLCRCTGYKKIIDSIEYAAELIKSDEIPSLGPTGKVGTRLSKYQAPQTVIGKRPFVDDLREEEMLHGVLKFSDHPRAKVISINTKEASKLPGVKKIITAQDIPGERIIGLIAKDWPFMVKKGEITRYVGDVLCHVIATSEDIARDAATKIKIDYEVLTPITDVDEALKNTSDKIHEKGNLLDECSIIRGDIDKILKESKFVSKGLYNTQRIEHAFLETECALALPTKDGVKLYSQGQGAYEDRKQVAKILNLSEKKVQVIQVQNGGGFGGKEDLTVQGHASLAAYIIKKPVRTHLTRTESMLMHPKRHPIRMDYILACNEKGKITLLIADIIGDTGAYASVGMKVLERAAGHATSAYHVPNVKINAKSVYTNNIPCGAMRGFGVNQTAFAMESCIDDLCEQGGFDRFKFRYDNALTEGSMVATGQVLKDAVGVKACLDLIKDQFSKEKYAGIAVGIKNCGIGNGMPDIGKLKVVIDNEKSVTIHHGWSEMGQGVHTMAQQYLCEETGIDPRIVKVIVDTDEDTVCGMTTSSRATSLVGHSMINACKKIKKDLATNTLKDLVGKVYHGQWMCDWTTIPGEEKKNVEPVTHYSYSYAAQLVCLDDNGKVKKIYAAHDAGRIVNPTLFEGQIEGAVHMGLGYALSEDFPMKDGRPLSTKLKDCKILRAKETPDVEVLGVEVNDPHGPHGARGVGEVGLVPTAAAVACAYYQFDKKRRYNLPLNKN